MSYVTHSTTLFVQPTKLTCSKVVTVSLEKTQQWFVKKNLHPRLTFLLIHPPLLNPASVNSTMHSYRFNHHHSLHFHLSGFSLSCFYLLLQTQTRIWLGEVLQIRLDDQLVTSELLADGELL